MQPLDNDTGFVTLWPGSAPGALGDDLEDQPRIVPYLVYGTSPKPAIVICPGGGYARRAAHEAEPVAHWLNSLGICAFVLHYRVAPYRHPYPLMDAQRAIRLIRHRADVWNIDVEKIGVLGFSAGGHLAATTGTHFDYGSASSEDPIERLSSRPDLLVLCYPVITFQGARHQGSMVNLIGSEAQDDLREQLSNEKQVRTDTAPTFLWHTSDDQVVSVMNSLLFAGALKEKDIPFELHVFPSGPHGLGLAPRHPEVAQWLDLCKVWLRAQGFGI